jgi:hypothetical protein
MVSHLYWAKMIAVSQTVSLTFDGYKKQFELSFLSFLHPYSLSAHLAFAVRIGDGVELDLLHDPGYRCLGAAQLSSSRPRRQPILKLEGGSPCLVELTRCALTGHRDCGVPIHTSRRVNFL